MSIYINVSWALLHHGRHALINKIRTNTGVKLRHINIDASIVSWTLLV